MRQSFDDEPQHEARPSEDEESSTPQTDSEEEDAGLVRAAQSGDSQAFEMLVRRYRNDVFAVAFHFVRNREEAWDIAQEAFIKAHRALNRFRGDARFKTWLLRITANQCKDFLKKRRVQTVGFDETRGAPDQAAPGQRPDDALAAEELGEAIRNAVDALPIKHRTVFILREFEGLSYEQMAEVIGCNVGTVMSRLHHARKKLQSHLVRMGVVEGK